MLTLFGKKKLTEERAAHIFVNGILSLIDEGFADVAGLINDSPEFVRKPRISPEQSGPFTMVVLAGNLQGLSDFFENGQDKRVTEFILEKFADIYDLEKMELAQKIADTRKFMARKNHPSKNTLNAMAKAIFCRYELNGFQEEYFRNLQSPNPIFIQRLKDALENFMWDWTPVIEKYKVVPGE